jgi:hypothetical protein
MEKDEKYLCFMNVGHVEFNTILEYISKSSTLLIIHLGFYGAYAFMGNSK